MAEKKLEGFGKIKPSGGSRRRYFHMPPRIQAEVLEMGVPVETGSGVRDDGVKVRLATGPYKGREMVIFCRNEEKLKSKGYSFAKELAEKDVKPGEFISVSYLRVENWPPRDDDQKSGELPVASVNFAQHMTPKIGGFALQKDETKSAMIVPAAYIPGKNADPKEAEALRNEFLKNVEETGGLDQIKHWTREQGGDRIRLYRQTNVAVFFDSQKARVMESGDLQNADVKDVLREIFENARQSGENTIVVGVTPFDGKTLGEMSRRDVAELIEQERQENAQREDKRPPAESNWLPRYLVVSVPDDPEKTEERIEGMMRWRTAFPGHKAVVAEAELGQSLGDLIEGIREMGQGAVFVAPGERGALSNPRYLREQMPRSGAFCEETQVYRDEEGRLCAFSSFLDRSVGTAGPKEETDPLGLTDAVNHVLGLQQRQSQDQDQDSEQKEGAEAREAEQVDVAPAEAEGDVPLPEFEDDDIPVFEQGEVATGEKEDEEESATLGL